MASIASNVQWGTGPKTYFDFSYEKKRDGSTQYYQITVSCDPITGSSYFGYPIYVQIFLDGVAKTSYTLKNASPSQWSSAISNTTGWLSVSNKTSGTTALKIRIYSGSGSSRDTTYNYNIAIDPAASTISCTTADIGSNPTITINRASSNFRHTLTYRFGNADNTFIIKTSATTITNWTIPEGFYSQIPNAKSGEGTLTCATYNGDTLIGETFCPLKVTTNVEKCKPSVSGTVVDTDFDTKRLTGAPDKFLVRYHSKALCTISASTNKNAGSIKARTINNTVIEEGENTLEIPNVETGVFEFWAKDSREHPNSEKVTMNLIPYIKLTANVVGQRTDPTSGNATLTIEGNYYDGLFNETENYLIVAYRQGNGAYFSATPTISNNKYSVTIPLSGLKYTQSFSFDVVVSDALEIVTKTVTIPKGIPVFDWGEEDFRFNVPVTINGVNILEKLAELERLVKG